MNYINSLLFFLCLFGLSIAQTSVSVRLLANWRNNPAFVRTMVNLKLFHLNHIISNGNLHKVLGCGSGKIVPHTNHKEKDTLLFVITIPWLHYSNQFYNVSMQQLQEPDCSFLLINKVERKTTWRKFVSKRVIYPKMTQSIYILNIFLSDEPYYLPL